MTAAARIQGNPRSSPGPAAISTDSAFKWTLELLLNAGRPGRSYAPKATRNADAQESETGLFVQVVLLPARGSLNGVLLV